MMAVKTKGNCYQGVMESTQVHLIALRIYIKFQQVCMDLGKGVKVYNQQFNLLW